MAKLEMKNLLEKAFRVKRRRFDNWFRLKCDFTKKFLGIKCWKKTNKDKDFKFEDNDEKYKERKYKYLYQ